VQYVEPPSRGENEEGYRGGNDDDDEQNEDVVFRFNEFEIRDAFLEFMTSMMSGYTKCLVSKFNSVSSSLECARLKQGCFLRLHRLFRF
jgi:hypothetical protein